MKPINKKTFSITEFCEVMGISRGHYYHLVKSGELRTIKLGGKTLITDSEVDRLLKPKASTPAEPKKASPINEKRRAELAGLFMQAMIAEGNYDYEESSDTRDARARLLARDAIAYANALLEELEA